MKMRKMKKKNELKVQHQNFLNQQNAIYMLFNRLSDYSDSKTSDDIFIHLINFGINILEV